MKSWWPGLLMTVLVAAGCSAAPAGPITASDTPTPAPTLSVTPSTPSPTLPSGTSTASAAPPAGTITWKACGGDAECGSLQVPLDPADPGGKRIRLVLLRLPATDPENRIGSLLVNYGGPGIAGTQVLAESQALFPAALRERFDIVTFDPRGAGLSTPIHCLDKRPAPSLAYPTEASGDAAFIAYAEAVAKGCESNSGDLLPFVGTPNVVADVEAIRVALGEPSISYLGFSYGTLLGALYADRYPNRVRAMVLDAPLDPSLDLEGLLIAMARGFQRQLDAFLAACAKDATCPLAADGDPRAAFEAAMAKFAGGAFDGVSQAVAISGVAGYLVYGDTTTLATALADVLDGEAGRLSYASAGLEPSRVDPVDAVTCVDLPGPRTPDELQAMADRLAAVSPDFGASLVMGGLQCLAWPVPAQREPATVRAAGAPPILVVTATGDPNTPPELGQALAAQLESGVLLARDGAGHMSMMRSDCVREIEERYLIGLETPSAGTVCR
jgi:pimeloyl-ACP methyl ester carboxylesterase